MNIVLVNNRGVSRSLPVRGGLLAGAALLALGSVGGTFYAGYRTAVAVSPDVGEPLVMIRQVVAPDVVHELDLQRERVEEVRRVADQKLNTLTRRLAQLQAHVVRLDALGQRLTTMGGLEDGEFDFTRSPAQGGPADAPGAGSLGVPDFLGQLDELAAQLEDRQRQLGLMETVLRNRNLQQELVPGGRPIRSGWISSNFGKRTDPFTGKQEYHEGIDLAGKEGSEVVGVASGVVVYSGERHGYGRLVEIDHGNGYVTRYGHNKENLVKVGERVRKGQTVALMGSSGRSTGPHVHFEVLQNGKPVDPMKYVKAQR